MTYATRCQYCRQLARDVEINFISIPFTNKSSKIVTAGNVISTIIAFVISATGYAIAEAVITQTNILVVLPASVPGSVIQSGGSAIIFIILGLVLDKMGFKKRFFNQEAKRSEAGPPLFVTSTVMS